MKWETCSSQYSWRWRQGEGSQRLLHENQYDSGKDSNCPVPQSHQETYYPLSVLPWYIQLSCCWHSMWAFPLFSTAPMVRHSRSSAFISAYLVNSPLSHKSSACPLCVLLLCFQPRTSTVSISTLLASSTKSVCQITKTAVSISDKSGFGLTGKILPLMTQLSTFIWVWAQHH